MLRARVGDEEGGLGAGVVNGHGDGDSLVENGVGKGISSWDRGKPTSPMKRERAELLAG